VLLAEEVSPECMVRDLWQKGFTKNVSFEFRMKAEEVMDRENGLR